MPLGLARRLTARQVLQQTSQPFPDPKERAAIFAQQLEGSTLHMLSFYRQTELRGRSAAVVQCPVLDIRVLTAEYLCMQKEMPELEARQLYGGAMRAGREAVASAPTGGPELMVSLQYCRHEDGFATGSCHADFKLQLAPQAWLWTSTVCPQHYMQIMLRTPPARGSVVAVHDPLFVLVPAAGDGLSRRPAAAGGVRGAGAGRRGGAHRAALRGAAGRHGAGAAGAARSHIMRQSMRWGGMQETSMKDVSMPPDMTGMLPSLHVLGSGS